MHTKLTGFFPDLPGKLKKLVDGKWLDVPSSERMRLTKMEGQVWIALFNLLLGPKCQEKYEFNSHNKAQILKVILYKLITIIITSFNKVHLTITASMRFTVPWSFLSSMGSIQPEHIHNNQEIDISLN